MSPRAAWRLESLGFDEVYEYNLGKLDWLAAGLPTEGSNAGKRRAGALAHKDVPTCTVNERLADVADRVRSTGWDTAVVVNQERIVFGLLRAKELARDGDLLVSQAMRPGPSTFRPYVLAEDMARAFNEHRFESTVITTSDGELVGLLLRKDVAAKAE
jgi:CBS domain-containing protein